MPRVKRPRVYTYVRPRPKKRPDVHSKNASRGQVKYKKPNRGQGRGRQALTKNLKNFKGQPIDFLKKKYELWWVSGKLIINKYKYIKNG